LPLVGSLPVVFRAYILELSTSDSQVAYRVENYIFSPSVDENE